MKHSLTVQQNNLFKIAPKNILQKSVKKKQWKLLKLGPTSKCQRDTISNSGFQDLQGVEDGLLILVFVQSSNFKNHQHNSRNHKLCIFVFFNIFVEIYVKCILVFISFVFLMEISFKFILVFMLYIFVDLLKIIVFDTSMESFLANYTFKFLVTSNISNMK